MSDVILQLCKSATFYRRMSTCPIEIKWQNNEAVRQLFMDFKEAYDSVRWQVLRNVLIEFGVHMKLVRLINMCLNETYSRVWVGKHLCHVCPIRNNLKQGDAVWPLLFNFVLQCAMRGVQVNQEGLKLNGTYQLVVYVKILGGNVCNIEKNTEALVLASKEIGLEVNADKSKYMVISHDQNEGRSHSTMTDNSFFERVEKFKHLGTTLTNQNSIQQEIQSRLKSGNACCHSVQNLLSSSLLSKNTKN